MKGEAEKTMKVVHQELYRNRYIVIVRVRWNQRVYDLIHKELKNMAPMFDESHNGYVSLSEESNLIKINGQDDPFGEISCEEITFTGWLPKEYNLPERWRNWWFAGFDTMHARDALHTESRSKESVLRRARELADELIGNGENAI